MISGQTMNLSRTTKDAANISIVARGQQHSSNGMLGNAMHASSSATPIVASEADIASVGQHQTAGIKIQPYSNAANKGGATQPHLANYQSQYDNNQASAFKQYNEEDGFMRGARIAEKIQEFYHTTAVPAGGFTSGSQTL